MLTVMLSLGAAYCLFGASVVGLAIGDSTFSMASGFMSIVACIAAPVAYSRVEWDDDDEEPAKEAPAGASRFSGNAADFSQT